MLSWAFSVPSCQEIARLISTDIDLDAVKVSADYKGRGQGRILSGVRGQQM
jgi:hypothetical protein